MEWLHAANGGNEELVSLDRVLAKAQQHQDRMSTTSMAPGVRADMKTPQALDEAALSGLEVSSYDDLSVTADAVGRVVLVCPACGHIPVPSRETTLSDLTNAAMEHLSEQHPYTLTLPSRRSRGTKRSAVPQRDRATTPSGYFTEKFWSLIAVLRENVSGMETLVRALASSSEEDILDFREQMRRALDMLDTPQQRAQQVLILDDPLRTVPAAMSDSEFEDVRVAVVAAGRDVWLDVLADPSRLAGGWSLQLSRGLLDAPEVALRHRTAPTPLHPPTTADGRNATMGAA